MQMGLAVISLTLGRVVLTIGRLDEKQRSEEHAKGNIKGSVSHSCCHRCKVL